MRAARPDSSERRLYVRTGADLGVFKGISGVLSAKGTFDGLLHRIKIHGETTVPEFALVSAGNPVPLHAKYDATVDGTNGDTFLDRVDASFLNTSLTAKGGVFHTPGRKGRTVRLDVTMTRARLEDLMRLAIKTARPPMTGALSLLTNLELPPGDEDVVKKLALEGHFQIEQTQFTDSGTQNKIADSATVVAARTPLKRRSEWDRISRAISSCAQGTSRSRR